MFQFDHPMSMHRWHGPWVLDSACGAMVGGRAQVLPCSDVRVKAYRPAVRAASRRWREVALGASTGAMAALLLGAAAVVRRRRPRLRPSCRR